MGRLKFSDNMDRPEDGKTPLMDYEGLIGDIQTRDELLRGAIDSLHFMLRNGRVCCRSIVAPVADVFVGPVNNRPDSFSAPHCLLPAFFERRLS